MRLFILAMAALHVSVGCGGTNRLGARDAAAGGDNGGDANYRDVTGDDGYDGGSEVHSGAGGPDADSSAESSATCNGLTFYQCNMAAGCTTAKCPTCNGTADFNSCYRAGVDPTPTCIEPPCLAMQRCQMMDENSCKTSTECHPSYCPDCQGAQLYWGCLIRSAGTACDMSCPFPDASVDR
jgi:hypothetical protein